MIIRGFALRSTRVAEAGSGGYENCARAGNASFTSNRGDCALTQVQENQGGGRAEAG